MAIKTVKDSNAADAVPSQEALAVMANDDEQQLAVIDPSQGGFGSVSGDALDSVPRRLPYLRISAAQGKLKKFAKGDIVIGDDNLIASCGEPVLITVISAQAFWKEYVGKGGMAYDPTGTILPRFFLTKEEVFAVGGTIDWGKTPDGKKIPPTFKVAMAINAIVRRPEKIIGGPFGIQIGGHEYAAVRWNVDKVAASCVAPIIKDDRDYSLKARGIYSGIYELTTAVKPFESGFDAAVPTIKLKYQHDNDAVAQIKELFADTITKPVTISTSEEDAG